VLDDSGVHKRGILTSKAMQVFPASNEHHVSSRGDNGARRKRSPPPSNFLDKQNGACLFHDTKKAKRTRDRPTSQEYSRRSPVNPLVTVSAGHPCFRDFATWYAPLIHRHIFPVPINAAFDQTLLSPASSNVMTFSSNLPVVAPEIAEEIVNICGTHQQKRSGSEELFDGLDIGSRFHGWLEDLGALNQFVINVLCLSHSKLSCFPNKHIVGGGEEARWVSHDRLNR
jgi:hypothetical protein